MGSRFRHNTTGLIACGIAWFLFAIVGVAAWFTHVAVCLSAGKWGFLIAGALVAPIAVIHGVGIWLGAW